MCVSVSGHAREGLGALVYIYMHLSEWGWEGMMGERECVCVCVFFYLYLFVCLCLLLSVNLFLLLFVIFLLADLNCKRC